MPKKHFGRSELGKASARASRDADALPDKRRCRAAIYVAGYAVECGLKQKLTEAYGVPHLDDLGALLVARGLTAGLRDVYTRSLPLPWTRLPQYRRVYHDRQHAVSLRLVNQWTVDWRYDPDGGRETDARRFVDAAATVLALVRANFLESMSESRSAVTAFNNEA